jgi:hypothetical protein
MESLHLPHAIMLVLVGEKSKAKRRKRSGSASGEASRPRMDRARRQAGGGMPAEAVGPRGLPLAPQYRGPGLPQAPMSAADVQRLRLLALQRARGGV